MDFNYLSGHWITRHAYELGRVFEDVDIELAFKAARAGLLYADFEVVVSDEHQYFNAGKRDPSKFELFFGDFRSVGASVYLKAQGTNVIAKVIYNYDEDLPFVKRPDGYSHNSYLHQEINRIFSGMNRFIVEEKIRLQKERRQSESDI
jgi:hypothetical protein